VKGEWGGERGARRRAEKHSPVTLLEVARLAGVSLTTASKAINGKDRVSEATRARVMTAARELSFTPSPIARGLTTGKTRTVGVIIADSMSYRFAVPVMLGAEAALSEIDLSVIACDARGDRARSLELARMLAARKVDGMLLVGDNNAVTASVTRHVDVPVVYVYGESSDPQDVVHMPNDSDGIGLAAGHLIAAGRRALAHLTGPRRATAVAHRVGGLTARLAGAGLQLAAPVRYGPWSQRWASATVTDLLTRVPGIDGVVCGSDQIASGVLVALDALGRAVPGDIAVTGYDNWPVFALESEPQLTTVDMNLEALGAAAARELFMIIDGEARPGGVRWHDCDLVIRGSTWPR
jgi:LacI family transcriptional regulator